MIGIDRPHRRRATPAPAATRSGIRWLTVALAAAALLIAAVPAHATTDSHSTPRYYLSLGDSLAYGFQRSKALAGEPPTAFDSGYANLVAADVEHGNSQLSLVNYGCPGESTSTYRTGPCPWTAAGRALHDPFSGPQQAAALGFLKDHRGHVDVVTLSLWSNDVSTFVASCNGDVQCILTGAPALTSTIASSLATTLGEIRRVAPDAQVVLLGAVDVNIGAYALTHPLIQRLNAAMAAAAAAARAGFADPFPVFDPEGDAGATVCALTLLCSDGDTHPSDAGYRAIGQLIEAQLR